MARDADEKNGGLFLVMWSPITALLKAKMAIDAICGAVRVTGLLLNIMGCMDGFAWFDSRSLIHVSLQGLQTTLAVKFNAALSQLITLGSPVNCFRNTKLFMPRTSPIPWLQRLSPLNFAGLIQNAH